jgi:hypothetical protein
VLFELELELEFTSGGEAGEGGRNFRITGDELAFGFVGFALGFAAEALAAPAPKRLVGGDK